MLAFARIPQGIRLAIRCTSVGVLDGSLLFHLELPWRDAQSGSIQFFRHCWAIPGDQLQRMGTESDLDSEVLACRNHEEFRLLRAVVIELIATQTRLIAVGSDLMRICDAESEMLRTTSAEDGLR